MYPICPSIYFIKSQNRPYRSHRGVWGMNDLPEGKSRLFLGIFSADDVIDLFICVQWRRQHLVRRGAWNEEKII